MGRTLVNDRLKRQINELRTSAIPPWGWKEDGVRAGNIHSRQTIERWKQQQCRAVPLAEDSAARKQAEIWVIVAAGVRPRTGKATRDATVMTGSERKHFNTETHQPERQCRRPCATGVGSEGQSVPALAGSLSR